MEWTEARGQTQTRWIPKFQRGETRSAAPNAAELSTWEWNYRFNKAATHAFHPGLRPLRLRLRLHLHNIDASETAKTEATIRLFKNPKNLIGSAPRPCLRRLRPHLRRISGEGAAPRQPSGRRRAVPFPPAFSGPIRTPGAAWETWREPLQPTVFCRFSSFVPGLSGAGRSLCGELIISDCTAARSQM